MANKIQTYTIVFNTAQPDVETAMQSIGSALSTEIIELISQGLLLFNIIDDGPDLVRRWSYVECSTNMERRGL